MADHTSSSGDSNPPNHLGTSVPSGGLESHDPEKTGHHDAPTEKPLEKREGHVGSDDEEEEEDMDALIEELESQDGQVEEEEESNEPGGARPVAEELLQTDTRMGLTDAEVTIRRKKFGLNQMKEEKENLILKFLGYFVGPIQFVMEVSFVFQLCATSCACALVKILAANIPLQAAAVLAAGLEDWVDFGVICALLLLNATVGFVQEYQAGSIVEELKKTLALKAIVLRDGRLTEVEAPLVVPGDILQIEEVRNDFFFFMRRDVANICL